MAKNHGYSRHDTCGGGSNFRNRHNADRRCDSRVDHDTGNRFAAGVAVLTGVGSFSGEEQAVREKASTSNRIARF